MANSIYNTKSPTSFVKYLEHAENVVRGMGAILLLKGTSGEPLIYSLKESSKINKKAYADIQSLRKRAGNRGFTVEEYHAALKAIPLELTERNPFQFTAANIVKKGDKIPMGYLAEPFLQAAIVAKFVEKRDEKDHVQIKDIIKYINHFIVKKSEAAAQSLLLAEITGGKTTGKSISKAFEYSAPNKNPKVGDDKVFVYYSLNDPAFRWLKSAMEVGNIANEPELKEILHDSMEYVNSGNCRDHVHYFYTNGRTDRIDIVSLGILGQGQTKADIRTQYYEGWTGGTSGKKIEMHLNLSVKIRHVDQVGQKSGINGATYSQLVNYFKLEFSKKQLEEIETHAAKLLKNPKRVLDKQAQGAIYDIVYNKLSEAKKVDQLLNGIEYFIAFNKTEAETLTVVDIGEGLRVYFVKNLEELGKRYKNATVKSEITTGGGKDGLTKTIRFSVNDEVLFQISSRHTGGVYRNFISTGPLLRQILQIPYAHRIK